MCPTIFCVFGIAIRLSMTFCIRFIISIVILRTDVFSILHLNKTFLLHPFHDSLVIQNFFITSYHQCYSSIPYVAKDETVIFSLKLIEIYKFINICRTFWEAVHFNSILMVLLNRCMCWLSSFHVDFNLTVDHFFRSNEVRF